MLSLYIAMAQSGSFLLRRGGYNKQGNATMTNHRESPGFGNTPKQQGARLHTPRESTALFTATPGQYERLQTGRDVSRSDALRGTMSENHQRQLSVRTSSRITYGLPLPAYRDQRQIGCLTPTVCLLLLAASIAVMLLFLVLLNR